MTSLFPKNGGNPMIIDTFHERGRSWQLVCMSGELFLAIDAPGEPSDQLRIHNRNATPKTLSDELSARGYAIDQKILKAIIRTIRTIG